VVGVLVGWVVVVGGMVVECFNCVCVIFSPIMKKVVSLVFL
jgi:hypothetical protein